MLPLSVIAQRAGDPLAGLLLFRIQHYLSIGKVERDGYRWSANTRDFWCKDTGMTLKQYKRAIKILIDKGLVETRVMRFGGMPMTHIRMLSAEHPDGPSGDQVDGPSKGQVVGPSGVHPYTGDQQEISQESNTSYCSADAQTEDSCIKKEIGKAIGAGAKAADIAALVKPKEIVPEKLIEQPEIKLSQLEALWKQEVAKATPGHVVVWSAKRTNQMKNLLAKTGHKLPLMLAHAIKNWPDFVLYAKDHAGAKGAPLEPQLWFLLFQAEALIAWYTQYCQEASNAPLQSISQFIAPTPKPTVVTPYVKPKSATPEDFDEIWGGQDAA